jgi:hypothetical protein
MVLILGLLTLKCQLRAVPKGTPEGGTPHENSRVSVPDGTVPRDLTVQHWTLEGDSVHESGTQRVQNWTVVEIGQW